MMIYDTIHNYNDNDALEQHKSSSLFSTWPTHIKNYLIEDFDIHADILPFVIIIEFGKQIASSNSLEYEVAAKVKIDLTKVNTLSEFFTLASQVFVFAQSVVSENKNYTSIYTFLDERFLKAIDPDLEDFSFFTSPGELLMTSSSPLYNATHSLRFYEFNDEIDVSISTRDASENSVRIMNQFHYFALMITESVLTNSLKLPLLFSDERIEYQINYPAFKVFEKLQFQKTITPLDLEQFDARFEHNCQFSQYYSR